MKILITGPPAVGKTTLCLKLYRKLVEKYKVGGVVSLEIRKGFRREGFKFLNLKTNEEIPLASKHYRSRYKIGRYGVYVENVDKVANVIESSIKENDITIIDEIGPMELLSEKFSKTVIKVFSTDCNIIATIHYRSNHPTIRRIKSRKDVSLYVLNKDNRDQIYFKILEKFGLV